VFSKTDFGSGLIVLWTFGYHWFFTTKYGHTPGKKFFGLKIVKVDPSGQIGALDGFLREVVGKFISSLFLSIGYLWILFDKNRQGWHDKIANTRVIQITPLAGFKKFLAYLLAFLLPLLAIAGIVIAVLLVAINPAKQIQKAKELQSQMELQQSLQKDVLPVSGFQTVTQGNMTMEIPGDWTSTEVAPGVVYADAKGTGVAVHVAPTTCYPTFKSFADDIAAAGATTISKQELTINGRKVYQVDSKITANGSSFFMKSYLLKGSKNDYSLAFAQMDQSEESANLVELIVTSIDLNEKSVIASTCY
jgi:hypothetical protein